MDFRDYEPGYGGFREERVQPRRGLWQRAKPYVIGGVVGLLLSTCGRGCASGHAELRHASTYTIVHADAAERASPSTLELLMQK